MCVARGMPRVLQEISLRIEYQEGSKSTQKEVVVPIEPAR
jgi:hypothetical protein